MRRIACAIAAAAYVVSLGLIAHDALPAYQDEDSSASYLVTPPGGRARFKAVIEASLRKNPNNPVALAHRAYYFNDMGDSKRAMRDFDAALAASEPGSPQARHVYWSRGWARYDASDFDGAILDWTQSARLHGGRPYWLPYTLALGYWTRGDAADAMSWFDIATASEPAWATNAGVREKTKHWSKRQQDTMWALYSGWQSRHATAGHAP